VDVWAKTKKPPVNEDKPAKEPAKDNMVNFCFLVEIFDWDMADYNDIQDK
jgi:hypothetical protein